MTEFKVLITTSGLGSRLGELSHYTNKSLLKVGDRAIISRILDLYPKNTKFVITLGFNGEVVRNYLKIAHPKIKFDFIKIDKYQGSGSSLLYTLFQAKRYLNCPFYFHASDTLIYDYKIQLNCKYNWMAVNSTVQSSDYRTINSKSGTVVSINEKGEMNYDYVYIGLSFIYDYKIFWKHTTSLIKQKIGSSDCDVLKLMLNKNIQYKVIENWLDTGNVDSYKYANKVFNSNYNILTKNDESIYFENKNVIKYFYNYKISKDRFKKTKLNLHVFPKIISYNKHFYSYEYVKGNLYSEVVNPNNFKLFLNWCDQKLWNVRKSKNFKKDKLQFYKYKTIERANQFYKRFKVVDSINTINGHKIPRLIDLINSINIDELGLKNPYFFHGDLILDNIIMQKNNSFKLIDWRQDFAGKINSGDILYDLAKLNHSIYINHSLVTNDSFKININKNDIVCDILVKKSLLDCRSVLKNFIINKNIKISHVKVITALIWINMSALHNYPLSLFLYYFGKLNLFLSIKDI